MVQHQSGTAMAATVRPHPHSRQVRLSRCRTPRIRPPDGAPWVAAGTATRRRRTWVAHRPGRSGRGGCRHAVPVHRSSRCSATAAPAVHPSCLASSSRAAATDQDSASRWPAHRAAKLFVLEDAPAVVGAARRVRRADCRMAAGNARTCKGDRCRTGLQLSAPAQSGRVEFVGLTAKPNSCVRKTDP